MNSLYLRHRNGNGKIFGNDAEVDKETFLDRTSSVGDNAEVHNSSIGQNSIVCDNAQVVNASLSNTTTRENARITGCSGTVFIADSEISGESRIWGAPCIQGVNLRNARVFGDAILIGEWALDEYVRIHTGVWHRPPRYRLIEGDNINVILSECVDGHFHLGCWCLPRETWFRKGYRERLGKRSGWTPAQIELAFDTFNQWAASSVPR